MELCMEKKETKSVETPSLLNRQTDLQDNYSIYHYFKEHPSVLIAFLSVGIAITTAVINYLSHLYLVAAYRGWNIPPILLSQDRWSYLYYHLASALIFALSITIEYKLMDIAFENWYKNQYRVAALFNWHRALMQHKRIKKQSQTIKTMKKTRLFNGQDINHLLTSHTPLKKASYVLIKDTLLSRVKIFFFWMILPAIGVSLCLLFSIVLVSLSMGEWSIKYVFQLWLYTIFISTFSLPLFARKAYPAYSGKAIAKYVKENWEKVQYEELEKVYFKQHITGTPNQGKQKFYSNEGLKQVGFLIITGFICLFMGIILPLILPNSAESIATYTEDGMLYAVAYYTGNTYVLEDAIQCGNTLYVDTDKQRIISNSNDMRIILTQFENVVLLSEKKGSDKTIFSQKSTENNIQREKIYRNVRQRYK